MLDIALHIGLELTGQGVWACLRGHCTHKHHRFMGDGLVLLVVAIITVHLIG